MMKVKRNRVFKNTAALSMVCRMLFVGAILFLLTAGCSSGPAQSPEQFVMKFIQKHIPMIDQSVADFYVQNERTGIIAEVNKSVEAKRNKGILASLKDASYDFSKVDVKVLASKTDYVDDEETNYVKLQATGNYTLTMAGKSESVNENEVFVLRSVRNQWKVTDKENPWK
jgi:hypothetical protein